MAHQPMMLMIQGVVFFVLYYVIFRAAIQFFDLKTLGREDNVTESMSEEVAAGEGKYSAMAHHIIDGLGERTISSLWRTVPLVFDWK